MIRSYLRSLVLGIAVLTLMALFYSRSQVVSVEEHDRYIHTLRTLQSLDVSFNENILKSRHAYLTNYDAIVENLRKLKTTSQGLLQLPQFVDPQTREKLQTHLYEYLRLISEKEMLSDRFKSENAILHNSLSFFPIAASELADGADSRTPQAAGEIRNLLRSILTYNLYPYEESLKRIELQVVELRNNQEDYAKFLNRIQLERTIRHAETILKYKGQLDSVTLELLNLPSEDTLQATYQVYYASYIEKQASANIYRLALYLLAIGLLIVIAYTIIRLRNSTVALNIANETLEQKVKDRTEDLRQTNEELTEKKNKLDKYVAELHEAHKELQRVAVTDELTGLFTRRFLFEWMEKQMASIVRTPGDFACLMLDIDFFKSINDTYGHGEGDQVLKKVAEVTKLAVRQSDIVGRYGGEEFLVLLPNTDQEQAKVVAEKIRAAIEVNIKQPKQVTTSIGIGSCECSRPSRESHNASELISSLLEIADQALYRAKEGGRNQTISGKKVLKLDQVHLVAQSVATSDK